MSEKTIRCPACASEFTDEDVEGHSSCPTCGHLGVPCAISEDVTLKINWHELRILGIWASNWAARFPDDEQSRHSKRALDAILKRLQAQHPDKAPLTLAGEMQQLATAVGTEVEIHDDLGRRVIKPGLKS